MRAPSLVVHCDWGIAPGKRWKSTANRDGGRYRLSAPIRVGDPSALLDEALAQRPQPTLIGFDFPIGLPSDYGRRTGLPDFRACVDAFGRGDWADWYEVADNRDDVSIRRPFYPARPGGRRLDHLLGALGAKSMNDIRRLCERPTTIRGAASPLFWTLGGNQVGKAAISGWRTFVIPALRRPGVALWPFDGALAALLASAALVIAETYPADAYGQVGIRFGRGMSKRRQSDRASFAPRLLAWATERGHVLAPDLETAVADGFGSRPTGEDAFDAFLGLCGMLEVVGEHRPDGAPDTADIRRWEGWIFGQCHEPRLPAAPHAPETARPDEDTLIARYFAPLAGPGADCLRDDAAVLRPTEGHDLVVTADAIVAGIHFFPDDPASSIARKAVGVNLSDLAAKGAMPRGFVLTLALPGDWTETWLKAFAAGLAEVISAYGCPLLGGDTVRTSGPTTISVTAFGEVPAGTMVPRKGAEPGDLVCVSGGIGDAALGLALRLDEALANRTAPADRNGLLDRYLHPQPRLSLGPILRRYARAAMDVSDGLVGDMAKMVGPGTTAHIQIAQVPLSMAASRLVAGDPRRLDTALTGGDDYEILCAIPPGRLDAFLAECAAEQFAMTRIGRIEPGNGPPVFLDEDGNARRFGRTSFRHF